MQRTSHRYLQVDVFADRPGAGNPLGVVLDADGWDTPLQVLGARAGFECARKNDIAALFIMRDGKNVKVRATPAWKEQVDVE